MSKSLRNRAKSISVKAPPAAFSAVSAPAVPLSIAAETTAADSKRKSTAGAKLLKKRQSGYYAPRGGAGDSEEPDDLEKQYRELQGALLGPEAAGRDVGEDREVDSAGLGYVGRMDVTLDVDRLAQDSFKAEEFLKQSLSSGAADQTAELRRLRTELERVKGVTERELQTIVYENYGEFMTLAREVTVLEEELLNFRGALKEWKSVPGGLGEGGEVPSYLGGGKRNSLVDLASLYKSQLGALWEHVEGAQKLVPALPGRHFVHEVASFVELHGATYQTRQGVHLFLFNDCVLIAGKKRRLGVDSLNVRLVAERMYLLREIVVADLRDGGGLRNAIKLKRGKETCVFSTDIADDKRRLLAAFKRVAEELVSKRRMEILHEAESRRGDTSTSSGTSPLEILGLEGDPTDWPDVFSDALTVSIATRQFEHAVSLVERARASRPSLEDDPSFSAFSDTLDALSKQLIESLLSDVGDPTTRRPAVLRAVSWLSRLDADEASREALLRGRALLVQQRVAQIDTGSDELDLVLYVNELALVTFTLIKNTCEWYMTAYKDNQMASVFVEWALSQFSLFSKTYHKWVYHENTLEPPNREQAIAECFAATKTHSALLRDVGLDFEFLLGSQLRSGASAL